jgi:hypothetical protein
VELSGVEWNRMKRSGMKHYIVFIPLFGYFMTELNKIYIPLFE